MTTEARRFPEACAGCGASFLRCGATTEDYPGRSVPCCSSCSHGRRSETPHRHWLLRVSICLFEYADFDCWRREVRALRSWLRERRG